MLFWINWLTIQKYANRWGFFFSQKYKPHLQKTWKCRIAQREQKPVCFNNWKAMGFFGDVSFHSFFTLVHFSLLWFLLCLSFLDCPTLLCTFVSPSPSRAHCCSPQHYPSTRKSKGKSAYQVSSEPSFPQEGPWGSNATAKEALRGGSTSHLTCTYTSHTTMLTPSTVWFCFRRLRLVQMVKVKPLRILFVLDLFTYG